MESEIVNLETIKARCIEEGECWIWQGSVSPGDVPSMRIPQAIDPKRPLVGVRRWIAQHQGKQIAGLFATNSCEDKRCVCPDHVVVMTRKRLQKRAGKTIRKNESPAVATTRVQARIRSGNLKIGYEKAREIRLSDKPAEEWAAELGCHVTTVFQAKSGKTWRDYSSPFAGLLA